MIAGLVFLSFSLSLLLSFSLSLFLSFSLSLFLSFCRGEKEDNEKQPSRYANDRPSKAVEEWAKCESLCAPCHEQGEKSAGVWVFKLSKTKIVRG